MAKKGKLLAALNAHKGRDYKIEKQQKQQKQKRTRARRPNLEEQENVEARPNASASMPDAESDGLESDGSEAAEATAVCRASITPKILDVN